MTEVDERAERVLKRALGPKEQIEEYLLTHDYTASIETHNTLVENMLTNPVETYMLFKDRLEKHGSETSFPEFEGVIGYLIKALFQNPDIYGWFKKDTKSILIDQLINKLIGIVI